MVSIDQVFRGSSLPLRPLGKMRGPQTIHWLLLGVLFVSCARPLPAAAPVTSNASPESPARASSRCTNGALSDCEASCDRGDARACYNFGVMLYQGLGIEANPSRAANLYQKACESGSAEACLELGQLFEYGKTVPRDGPRAAQLLKRACDGGSASACQHLGSMLQNGTGIPHDYARARLLATQACAAGEARGCSNLGVLVERGLGGEADNSRAVALYTKACSAGILTAVPTSATCTSRASAYLVTRVAESRCLATLALPTTHTAART